MSEVEVEVLETGADYEIRRAAVHVGGLGRSFLRSRDILQLLYAERQSQFTDQVSFLFLFPNLIESISFLLCEMLMCVCVCVHVCSMCVCVCVCVCVDM